MVTNYLFKNKAVISPKKKLYTSSFCLCFVFSKSSNTKRKRSEQYCIFLK
eukprot:UN07178